MKLTIKTKFLILELLFLAAIVAIFSLGYKYAETYVVNNEFTNLTTYTQQAETVEDIYNYALENGFSVNFSNTIQTSSKGKGKNQSQNSNYSDSVNHQELLELTTDVAKITVDEENQEILISNANNSDNITISINYQLINKILNVFKTILIVLLVVIIIGLIGLFFYVQRKLLRNINLISQQAVKISQFNFDSHLNANKNTKDELELLKKEINLMQDTISGYLEQRNVLITAVAHEIKSPLASIISAIESYKYNIEPFNEIKYLNNFIIDQTQIIELNVNKSINIYQKYSEENKNQSKCDVNALIANFLNANDSIIISKNIKISKKITNDTFVTNEDKITFILNNLLSNAVKYALENSEILIAINDNQITIENSIDSKINSGSAVGLKVSKIIARELGIDITTKIIGNKIFSASIIF